MAAENQTRLPTFGYSGSSFSPISCRPSPNITIDVSTADQKAGASASLPPTSNVNNNDGNPNSDEEDDANVSEIFLEDEDISPADKEFFESLPPGYSFHPSDSDLIVHYLQKKINKEALPRHQIRHINLYRDNPEVISAMYPPAGKKEWFFFTPRNRKYPNGHRPNRAAGRGYWKATGADKPITHNNKKVGFRKALVYYAGKPPKGTKTNWIMHEYRVDAKQTPINGTLRLDDFVLCRIYKKEEKSPQKRNNENAHADQNIDDEDASASEIYRAEEGSQLLDPSNNHFLFEDVKDVKTSVRHAFEDMKDIETSAGLAFEDMKDIETSAGLAQSSYNNHLRNNRYRNVSLTNMPRYYGNGQILHNYRTRPISFISSTYSMENTSLSSYLNEENTPLSSYLNEDLLEIKPTIHNMWNMNMTDYLDLSPVGSLAELDTLLNNFPHNRYETSMTTSNVGIYPSNIEKEKK